MSFQFYETLLDKSKKRLVYLAEQIVPAFRKKELLVMLDDLMKIEKKVKRSGKIDDFHYIDNDKGPEADYSSLTEDQLQQLYKVFISRELSDRLAVKWRFYQFLKLTRQIDISRIQVCQFPNSDGGIEFLLETKDSKLISVIVFDTLNYKLYQKGIEKVMQFIEVYKIIPDQVIIVANKSYRNISLNDTINLQTKTITPELWLEWTDNIYPFNSEDLLIINNNEITVAGFNFSGMTDLLDYVYSKSNGQISIFRSRGFFTENFREKPKLEKIWKGLIIKTQNTSNS
ncbi:MAG: hypothetical protein ACFFD2_08255 [Promethearchaeota archaeon]